MGSCGRILLRFLPGSLLLPTALLLLVAGSVIASGENSATLAARVKANPLEIKLTLSEHEVAVGERFLINVSVKNRGDIALREAAMTLHLIESPCLKVNGPLTQHRGVLQGGKSASHVWHVQAIGGGSDCRSIVVAASASTVDPADGETLRLESSAQLLEIK